MFEKKLALSEDEVRAMSDEEMLKIFEQEVISFSRSDIPWQSETAQKNITTIRNILVGYLKERRRIIRARERKAQEKRKIAQLCIECGKSSYSP